MVEDILKRIHEAAAKRVLFLPHAIQQMSRAERMLSAAEVEAVVGAGELIEDYQDDPRGHSCLLLGQGTGRRAIHVLCSPKDEYLAIITAYVPDPAQWSSDFKRRL